ncbi:uncharacterized protein LOC106057707 [Biomphalaria glabrata]|uniref:Uncharacterized protein LOC106057707 n=1 Tax=Biomphalaria glabrata TaxID=6526 RepID=A0A9W2ZBZ4_BIOGL|nr:uncharacterized protein LOC106057707 [Biomphalaria glabrata]
MFEEKRTSDPDQSSARSLKQKRSSLTCSEHTAKTYRLFVGDDYHCRLPSYEQLASGQYARINDLFGIPFFELLKDSGNSTDSKSDKRGIPLTLAKGVFLMCLAALACILEFCDLSSILANLYLYGTVYHRPPDKEPQHQIPIGQRKTRKKRGRKKMQK